MIIDNYPYILKTYISSMAHLSYKMQNTRTLSFFSSVGKMIFINRSNNHHHNKTVKISLIWTQSGFDIKFAKKIFFLHHKPLKSGWIQFKPLVTYNHSKGFCSYWGLYVKVMDKIRTHLANVYLCLTSVSQELWVGTNSYVSWKVL